MNRQHNPPRSCAKEARKRCAINLMDNDDKSGPPAKKGKNKQEATNWWEGDSDFEYDEPGKRAPKPYKAPKSAPQKKNRSRRNTVSRRKTVSRAKRNFTIKLERLSNETLQHYKDKEIMHQKCKVSTETKNSHDDSQVPKSSDEIDANCDAHTMMVNSESTVVQPSIHPPKTMVQRQWSNETRRYYEDSDSEVDNPQKAVKSSAAQERSSPAPLQQPMEFVDYDDDIDFANDFVNDQPQSTEATALSNRHDPLKNIVSISPSRKQVHFDGTTSNFFFEFCFSQQQTSKVNNTNSPSLQGFKSPPPISTRTSSQPVLIDLTQISPRQEMIMNLIREETMEKQPTIKTEKLDLSSVLPSWYRLNQSWSPNLSLCSETPVESSSNTETTVECNEPIDIIPPSDHTGLPVGSSQSVHSATVPAQPEATPLTAEDKYEAQPKAKAVPVTTHQVIFPTDHNGQAKPYEFDEIKSAFTGVDFGPLLEKFKTESVTPELWYKGGLNVLRKHFPTLRLTNAPATPLNTPEINLYVGVAGESTQLKQLTILTNAYYGVTGSSVLFRSNGRAHNEWSTDKCKKFKDAVTAANSVTYKYLKIESSQETDEEDPKIKFVLEKCLFRFISHVNLSSKLYNHRRSENEITSFVSKYIPNVSDQSKLGAFLLAPILAGRYKFIEGGAHTLQQDRVRKLKIDQSLAQVRVGKFSCQFCPFQSEKRGGVGIHMQKHRKNKCDACGAMCTRKDNLQEHIASNHPEICKNRCETCKSIFSRLESLDSHNRLVHITSPGQAKKCSICGGIFAKDKQLEQHLNTVHKKDNFSCKICDLVFVRPLVFQRHNAKHHNGPQPNYKCSKCTAVFWNEAGLRSHDRGVHRDIGFECFICRQSFTEITNLKRHLCKFHN